MRGAAAVPWLRCLPEFLPVHLVLNRMPTTAKIVALCCWLGACAFRAPAQQSPALPPTIAAPTEDFSRPPEVPRHPARVEFEGSQLKVLADNSSLNEILTEIATRLGMKITGGIADECVFGTYGPADAATVLAHLLAGAGTNILVLENADHLPRELILTPRVGGPTPPEPGTAPPREESGSESDADADTEDLPPARAPHLNNSQQVPAPTQNPLFQPGFAQQGTAPANSLPPTSTTQQSPNGVKTPQQIYDQLMQLQQKNAPAAPR